MQDLQQPIYGTPPFLEAVGRSEEYARQERVTQEGNMQGVRMYM